MPGPTPNRSLRQDVRSVAAELRRLRRDLDALRQDRRQSPRLQRLAVTYDDGSYPQQGGLTQGLYPKFPIEFVDATFTAAAGYEAIAPAGRGSYSTAAKIDRLWVPPGTLVEAFWSRAPGQSGGGEWWIDSAVEDTTGGKVVLLRAKDCKSPGGSISCDLMQLSGTTGNWVDSGVDVIGHDAAAQVHLLPGEYCFAKVTDWRYDLIGSQGLFRKVQAAADIPENSTGTATIYDTTDSCTGLASNCQISVCNGSTNALATRRILSGELFWARYTTGRWHAIYGPLETVRVELASDASCRDVGDSATFKLLEYDSGTNAWSDSGNTVTVHDPDKIVFMLPGEQHFAVRHRGRYFFASPFGLLRKGRAAESISPGSSGEVTIVQHAGDCAGSNSNCSVTACNGSAATDSQGYIFSADTLMLSWLDDRWHAIARPQAPFIMGKLDSNLNSGSTGTLSVYSDASTDTGDNITVRNETGRQLLSSILMRAWLPQGWSDYLVDPYEMEPC